MPYVQPVYPALAPAYPYSSGYGKGFSSANSQALAHSKSVSINTPGGLSISYASAQAGSDNHGGGLGDYRPIGYNTEGSSAHAVANANSESFIF